MTDLNKLTLSETIEGLRKKDFSKTELINDTLSRIKDVEPQLFAFVSVNEQAQTMSDEKQSGVLAGIPFAVKEVLSTKEMKTTASSKILKNYLPPFEATVIKRIKNAGGIIIGKTNCDAFAFGASTENSGFGPTRNPWNLERVPGGSSGGSAAAVATDECIFALGTDTGGSIRQPSSFCNITGLKPTYGACSRYGLLAMASSFDCPGPMGKTVEDCEIVFNIMKGKDERDATSSREELKDIGDEEKRITIGLPKEFFAEGIDSEVKDLVKKAAQLFADNDFVIKEISLPHTQYAIAAYYVLVSSEISSNMARYDGNRFGDRRETFEDEVKRRIMLGTYTLSAGYFDQYYLKALKVRNLIQKDYLQAFQKVDLILGPVSPTPPFKIGEKST
ncbi:MAG: amidase, partial [Microgenomates group bacterium]